MPHRLTRPEVITRIAIKALLDACPSMTRRQLITFFHVSSRTVTDATRSPVSRWATILATAPAPSKSTRVKPVSCLNTMFSSRPGSRTRAHLVEPEPTIDVPEPVDFDVEEPEIDDAAMERAITEALDDMDREACGVPAKRPRKEAS